MRKIFYTSVFRILAAIVAIVVLRRVVPAGGQQVATFFAPEQSAISAEQFEQILDDRDQLLSQEFTKISTQISTLQSQLDEIAVEPTPVQPTAPTIQQPARPLTTDDRIDRLEQQIQSLTDALDAQQNF